MEACVSASRRGSSNGRNDSATAFLVESWLGPGRVGVIRRIESIGEFRLVRTAGFDEGYGMKFLAILFIFAVSAWGQEEAVEREVEVPKRSVRLLAVGNSPPYRQEVRDGVRYELPPPPGSIPPRNLTLVRMTEEDPVELGELRLQLGRLSGKIELRGGEGTMQLRDDKGVPWATVPCPAEGDFLVLLWRDPSVGVWTQPKLKVVPDLREPGKVSFLNVSRSPVAIVVGERRRALKPLQQWAADLAGGKPVSFQLGVVKEDGQLEREVSLALEQSEDESTLVIMSSSDGERARSPLKVTRLRERVR